MKLSIPIGILVLLFLSNGCGKKQPKLKASIQKITESVYASGVIKSEQQYQAFPQVSGIIKNIFVKEGDSVAVGTKLFYISNETNQLNRQNAELNAYYNKLESNQNKIQDALLVVNFTQNKLTIDSSLWVRQQNLWQQNIGSRLELEQKELAYQNSKTNHQSAILKYKDLKKQLSFAEEQSANGLRISSKLENDYFVKSEISGMVYSLPIKVGEMVNPQTTVAIIGSALSFIIELQIDEFDIVKIKIGQQVFVQMDSYKGQEFEAIVTKINPIMDVRTKTFKAEAKFIKAPAVLYPNLTAEANIVIQTKNNALTLPRNTVNQNKVIKANGDTVLVKTGLKDYQRIEILDGISAEDEVLNLSL